MNSSAFLPLAFLTNPFASLASALGLNGISNPISGPSAGGGSNCISGTVALSINTPGVKISYQAPQDQKAVTGAFVEMFQVGSSFAADIISGPSTISGTYKIFVKLCLPTDPDVLANVKTVQLLSHGATLDHTYWDIAPGYSYVDVASAAGYATLSYDQLGVGRSDHPDPIQVVQATSQVAVTHALAGLLRSSKLGGYKFDKVVGVGHSAGSTLTQAITTQYPKDFDAVILSGTTASADTVALTVAAFNLINANTDPSNQFRSLAPGYLTQQTSVGIQFAFYRFPNFDDDVFRRQVAHKSTNTLGVLLTLGSIVAPSPEFTGPVDLVNGEHDLVFCGGNCVEPVDQNQAALSLFYSAAGKGSQSYIAAGAGHSIAAHKSGPDSFKHMVKFLQDNGL
ncbi:alpha/beta-hydrolase [Daldinia caldariorum]|uniref:alpha/beta-hydrolase n=1 Tax=Daldinia caldariorum TaxID=326644 RepID=UPI002008AA6E|nr:alpha/beta-hydrolase [Daldinia caldariorum]KAI1465648.1 alpha/beta-hydrolase [Daldinia caldariorum]